MFDGLKSFQKWDLEHSGYYFTINRDIYGVETAYYFKPFFHETARHGILVYEVAKYLKNFTDDVKTYLSRKPDIVFKIKGEEWAVEVETGKVLKYNKKQFLEQVENLKEIYEKRWFFVITNRNQLKSYKRDGKTFTRRNVVSKIRKLFGTIY